MLESFERAKMLFRWQAEDGAVWGYWIGIDKPGRLPSGTDQKNGAKGAAVPQDSLQSFISSGNRPQPDNDQSMTGQGLVEGRCGFCLGSGLGLGKDLCADSSSPHESVTPQTPKPLDGKPLTVGKVWSYYIQKLGKNPKLLTFTAVRKKKGM